MKRTIRIFTTALLVIVVTGNLPLGLSEAINNATCSQPNLTDTQQALLDKYLILREENGELTLSQTLGYSCEIRRNAAVWISDMISGQHSLDDKVFERSHGDALNQIVLQVWPAIANSPAFPSDGALRYDKWNVLSNASVSDETVGRIVSQEVRKGGLWTAEAHLMFSRSLDVTSRLIKVVLADNKSDIISRLYAFALETRLKSGSPDLSIASVINGVALTETQAGVVENLRKRIEAHEPAKWSDVEDLAQDEL